MTSLAERVSTVVLVMMENRSFDHMLGHLTLENLVPGVNGLQADLSAYENVYKGGGYLPFPMKPRRLSHDLPHEWHEVATQLSHSPVTQQFTMKGFVEAYAAFTKTRPAQQAAPMGYFASRHVPITSFLARSFRSCDRWHAPLPTSTQPNRTMAFCGASQIFDTSGGARIIPCDDILFDWLDRAQVRWRVYHDGLSFFALYSRAWKHVLGEHFRDFEYYFRDMQSEPVESGPQVIVVEPSYNDAPHIGPDHPNDNHPPLAVGWGEDFLRRVYQAATVNPERWKQTVLIYYYDEHGGFHDHEPPPPIGYDTRGNPSHAFESLGPRVPAVVVSPLVAPGTVCNALFDHTSVLQLLAEIFTPGTPYSDAVEERRQQGICNLSVALDDVARTDLPKVPADPIQVDSALGSSVAVRPATSLQASFELAARQLMDAHHDAMEKKYPDLFHWRAAVDAERGQAPA